MNNTDFLSAVVARVGEISSYNKITIFTIATTTMQEGNAYLTPIRNNDQFVISGCIIFGHKDILPILRIIDGAVDIILIDSEKKIPIRVFNSHDRSHKTETVGDIETGSISKICFQHINKSKVFEFKPNDLTVNAAWLFLSQRLHFLSGKKISILGAGNIGSKLALKIVECGADVHLYRRDDYKGFNISHGLNLIKPLNTISTIHFHQSAIQAAFMSDVVIGATSGYQILSEDIINSVKKDCLIVDLGKNNISANAIKLARKNSMEIYRVDVTPALESYVHEVLKMQAILANSYGRKELGCCNIVSGGYFGDNGDVVVDNLIKPDQIIGISDGNGNIKKNLNSTDKVTIIDSKKEFGID